MVSRPVMETSIMMIATRLIPSVAILLTSTLFPLPTVLARTEETPIEMPSDNDMSAPVTGKVKLYAAREIVPSWPRYQVSTSPAIRLEDILRMIGNVRRSKPPPTGPVTNLASVRASSGIFEVSITPAAFASEYGPFQFQTLYKA